jgi:hypothetical protein
MNNLKSLLSSFKVTTQTQSFFCDDIVKQMNHLVYDALIDNYIEIIRSLDELSFTDDISYTILYSIADNTYSLEKRNLLCRVLFVIFSRNVKENEENIVLFSKTFPNTIMSWIEESISTLISDHKVKAKFAIQFGAEMPVTIEESLSYRKKLFTSFEEYISSKDNSLYPNFYSALEILNSNNIQKLKVNTW